MLSTGEMLAVSSYYLSILEGAGVKPLSSAAAKAIAESEEKLPLDRSGKSAVVDLSRQLSFAAWKLTDMQTMARAGGLHNQRKFLHALCFVHAVMWVAGILTIPEMERDIRRLIG